MVFFFLIKHKSILAVEENCGLYYQKDQEVQEQRVEEGNGSGRFVGENHASLKDTFSIS